MKKALALSLLLALACSPASPTREVTVVATNYALRLPASLPPGPLVIRLRNDGSVAHEIQVYRFAKGTPADSARRMMACDDIPDSVADNAGGVLTAGAATETPERLLLELRAGEMYAVICEFRDNPTAMKHAKLGMFALIEVK